LQFLAELGYQARVEAGPGQQATKAKRRIWPFWARLAGSAYFPKRQQPLCPGGNSLLAEVFTHNTSQDLDDLVAEFNLTAKPLLAGDSMQSLMQYVAEVLREQAVAVSDVKAF
jgi:hypothetical protein